MTSPGVSRISIRRTLLATVSGLPATVAIWLGAALMLVSGVVHVHLWDIAYRHVATLGPLFLVQAALSLVVAVALAVFRRAALILAGMALMAGTIVGFILVVTTGLFGFKLQTITGWADLALASESAAVVVLGVAGSLIWQRRSPR